MICFCKQIIHKATKTNTYCFTVDVESTNEYDEDITKNYQLCGQMFRRGEYELLEKPKPYGELVFPPLPDLLKIGVHRKGMHHLAGLCPRHAVLFEDRFYNVVKHVH